MSFDGEGFGDDGEPRLEPEEEDEIGGIDVFAKDIDDDEDFSLEEILREREGEKDGIEDQQPIFSNPKKSNLTSDIADDMIGRGILGGAREERKVADFVGVMEYEDEENLLRTQSSVDKFVFFFFFFSFYSSFFLERAEKSVMSLEKLEQHIGIFQY